MVCNRGDRSREFSRINGLRDVRLESCGEASITILGARIAGQRHRREKPSVFSFMLPNPPDQSEPVLIR